MRTNYAINLGMNNNEDIIHNLKVEEIGSGELIDYRSVRAYHLTL